MSTDWPAWYGKARNKQPYFDQIKELVKFLSSNALKQMGFDPNEVHSVLDIGGGDRRLEKIFSREVEYACRDLTTTGHDLTTEEGWQDLGIVDLGICSLFLLCLNEEQVHFVLKQAMKHCKYLVIYEETTGVESPINSDKFNHDYWGILEGLGLGFFIEQRSDFNPLWRSYFINTNLSNEN